MEFKDHASIQILHKTNKKEGFFLTPLFLIVLNFQHAVIALVAVIEPVEMTPNKPTINIVASTRSATKSIALVAVIEPVEMTPNKYTINIVASTCSATKGIALVAVIEPVEMTPK